MKTEDWQICVMLLAASTFIAITFGFVADCQKSVERGDTEVELAKIARGMK